MAKVNRKFMIGIILIVILLVVSLIILPFVSGFGVKSVSNNNNMDQIDTINIARIKDTGGLDDSSQQEDGYDNTGDSEIGDNGQALKDDYGEGIFTDRNINAEDNQTEDNGEEEEPVNVGQALEEDQDG